MLMFCLAYNISFINLLHIDQGIHVFLVHNSDSEIKTTKQSTNPRQRGVFKGLADHLELLTISDAHKINH